LLSRILIVFVVHLAFAPSFLTAEEKRFVAKLSDGQIVEDDVLRNWYSDNAMPQIAGHSLLEGNVPMRWMMDRTLSPSEVPASYVELVTGDRLPGMVIGYRASSYQLSTAIPEHFEVLPSVSLIRSSDRSHSSEVRVKRSYIRKIVWNARPSLIDRYVPSTIFLTNGREITFRAVRFSQGAVQVLSERERMDFSFGEIAELHLERSMFWKVCLDELATLFPNGKRQSDHLRRLVQWETNDGLIATTSVSRINAESRGDNNNSDRWLHGIQPAWSLDELWIECADTWMRRSWAFDEIPLFRIPYQENRDGAMFSRKGYAARINRAVLGSRSQIDGAAVGWSFGVMAPSRLVFELPEISTGVDLGLGLDDSARRGGSVQGRVSASWQGSPLAETEILVGSGQSSKIGPYTWKSDQKDATLTLEVDPLLNDAPEGADPYDIRDMANWMEPILRLDRKKLELEIREHTKQMILAWENWQLATDLDSIEFMDARRKVSYRDENPTWRTMMVAKEPPFKLQRKLSVDPSQQVLEIHTAKISGPSNQPKLSVFANGILQRESFVYPINTYDRVHSSPPLLVDLQPFLGSEVDLEIVAEKSSTEFPIDWRGIEFRNQSSYLLEVLENPTLEFVQSLTTPQGEPAQVKRIDSRRWLLQPAIETRDGEWVQIAKFDPPLQVREHPLPGEFRRLRFAFAKRGGGQIMIELLHADSETSPAIYEVGSPAVAEGAVRINRSKLDESWHMHTPDLFSNFREIEIEGIAIQSVGEGTCLWDHFYFAGSDNHFRAAIPMDPLQQNWDDWIKRQQDWNQHIDEVVVGVNRGDGQSFPGIVVDDEPINVVTYADANWKPGTQVEVAAADGNTYAATMLKRVEAGPFGVLQVEKTEGKQWRRLDLSHREKFDDNFTCILMQPSQTGYQWDICRGLNEGEQQMILSPPNFECQLGAIAVDRDMRISGFVSGFTPNGNPILINAFPLRDQWDALRKTD